MAQAANGVRQGQPAIIDPDLLTASIKRRAQEKIEQKVQETVPPLIRNAANASIQTSAAGSAVALTCVATSVGLGAAGPAIAVSMQGSANATQERLAPTIEASANATARCVTTVAVRSMETSVDAASSIWN